MDRLWSVEDWGADEPASYDMNDRDLESARGVDAESSSGAISSSPAEAPPSGQEAPAPDLKANYLARTDLVCRLFVEGLTLPQIHTRLKRYPGMEDVGRELAYHDITRALRAGYLTYNPPREKDLSARLKDNFGLLDAHVPSLGERMSTVAAAAEMICTNTWFIALDKVRKRFRDDRMPFLVTVAPPGEKGLSGDDSRNGSDGDDHRAAGGGASGEGNGESESMNLAKVRIRRRCLLDEVDFGVEESRIEPDPIEIEIRVGVSGGRTVGLTMEELGKRISIKVEEWEKDLKIEAQKVVDELGANYPCAVPGGLVWRRIRVDLRFVFINLVSGFDLDRLTHPVAFLTAMVVMNEPLGSRSEVKCFNATPLVEIGKRREVLEQVYGSKKARDFFDEKGLDIIVTSAGSIDDEHSTFSRYYRWDGPGEPRAQNSRVREILKKYNVEGDFLWLPVVRDKSFSFKSLKKELSRIARENPEDEEAAMDKATVKYRPMTLVNLTDIARHIAKKLDVYLVLCPCGKCYQTKEKILFAVLKQPRPLVSHLICDSATADATLKKLK